MAPRQRHVAGSGVALSAENLRLRRRELSVRQCAASVQGRGTFNLRRRFRAPGGGRLPSEALYLELHLLLGALAVRSFFEFALTGANPAVPSSSVLRSNPIPISL